MKVVGAQNFISNIFSNLFQSKDDILLIKDLVVIQKNCEVSHHFSSLSHRTINHLFSVISNTIRHMEVTDDALHRGFTAERRNAPLAAVIFDVSTYDISIHTRIQDVSDFKARFPHFSELTFLRDVEGVSLHTGVPNRYPLSC